MLLVAVHAGAGFHAHSKAASLRSTMERACREAIAHKDGMEACVAAIRVLEDCPLTNAGIGSCLTLDGRVECDASVMSGASGDFGAVGCLPHTRHPIEAAHAVWMQRTRGRMSLGRVPPMILAGAAAHEFAKQHAPMAEAHPAGSCTGAAGAAVASSTAAGTAAVAAASSAATAAPASSSSPPCPLLTEASMRKWASYRTSLHDHEAQSTSDAPAAMTAATAGADASSASPTCTLAADQLSTVGAIVVAPSGDVFAGVSSGGIWMKMPGRVGHAAAFGAGCSAYNPSPQRAGAAVSISGTGEQIIERLLSFTIAQQMRQANKPPVATPAKTPAVAAVDASGKRKKEPAQSQSKRQRLPSPAATGAADSSSNESDSAEDDEGEEQEEEPEESQSLDSILRRALQDEQPAAFDTTPPGPAASASTREALAAGVIALRVPALSKSPSTASAALCIDLLWAHSTPHFAVGYLARGQAPVSFISAATMVGAAQSNGSSNPSHASVVVAGQRFRFAS